MAQLAEWSALQDEFASALLDTCRAIPEGLVDPDGETSVARFSVYRNNVFVGLIDALRAGFPCVVRLVGDDFFAAMARVFVAAHPPASPVMLRYGAGFPDFIASFAPAAALPWLADVARIERAATEAYHARDAVALSPVALADVPPDQAPQLRFRFHPSVRMLRSRFPAFTIWRMNTADGVPAPVDLSKSQDTMVLRPEACVDVRHVLPASHDFVVALQQGLPLSQAADIAQAADAHFDLAQNLRELIQMGAFIGFDLDTGENNHALHQHD